MVICCAGDCRACAFCESSPTVLTDSSTVVARVVSSAVADWETGAAMVTLERVARAEMSEKRILIDGLLWKRLRIRSKVSWGFRLKKLKLEAGVGTDDERQEEIRNPFEG